MSTSGGGRFEKIGSYVRAKRIGPFVYVAGTTAIEPSGKLHAPGDTYAQTLYAFDRITDALTRVGAEVKHVVRTRAYLADMKEAGGLVRSAELGHAGLGDDEDRRLAADPAPTDAERGGKLSHCRVSNSKSDK